MKLPAHIAVSTLGAVSAYELTGSQTMGISLFFSGIFIDLDHLSDYILLSGERFSVPGFFSWFYEERWKKIYLLFHSYELLGILALIAFWLENDVVTGVVAGSALHLLLDQIDIGRVESSRRLSPWFYFVSYRYFQEFEKKRLRMTVRPP